MLTVFDKALATVVVGLIGVGAQHFFSRSLTVDEVAIVTTLVSGIIVYLVPNKQ